jgi:AraC family transcriptional regulator
MNEQGAYGSRLADKFDLQNPPTMVADALRHGELAVTELRSEGTGHTMTKPIPREDAFFVSFMINECPNHELWVDGHSAAVKPLGVGDSMIYDLKQEPIALIRKPYRLLLFYLPRLALDAIAEDANAAHVETLHHQPGRIIANPIFKQLASTLVPMLEQPQEASSLFVDHVLHAVGIHIAHAYGGMRINSHPIRGGLAAWQERRAKELMDASLDSDVTLVQLASECKLSVSQFSRAFRQSNGCAPHHWLMSRRVDNAKRLLRDQSLALADVALACGFADQSHFTRVFKNVVGASPGVWRRMRIR